MPAPSNPQTAIREHAGQSLHSFGSLLADLVLDPNASLGTADLDALKASSEALLDLVFVGDSRRRTRGLSGSTNAEQLARTSAFHSTADAHAFLQRLGHSLTLLQRIHGPQALDVRVEKCELPHVVEGAERA